MPNTTPPSPPRPPREPFTADFSEGLETGLYLALLELIDEGLIITGDETIIDANTAACRLLERDYRQLAGQPLATLFPSERAFLEARERLLIQGEMRGGLRVSLPGGRSRDMRFTAAARLRPGLHALILSPDIVAEAYSAGKVEKATDPDPDPVWPRLAAALEQPLIVLDEQGRIQALNAAAHRSFDGTARPQTGRPLSDFFETRWSAPHEVPSVHLRPLHAEHGYTARILPGPRPDWRLLLLPAEGGLHSSLPAAAAGQTLPAATESAPGKLAQALTDGTLRLRSQAGLDTRSGQPTATLIEAVWRESDTNEISPRAQAEQEGLAAAFDRWLITQALQEFPPLSGQPAPLCLALAGRPDAGLLTTLTETLRRSGQSGRSLELAFGSQALQNADSASLHALRDMQTGIVLDEVGEAPLAVRELARQHIDVLMLSPALVRTLTREESSEVLIDSAVELARRFKVELRACGVETAAESDFLSALGVAVQHGPLFNPQRRA